MMRVFLFKTRGKINHKFKDTLEINYSYICFKNIFFPLAPYEETQVKNYFRLHLRRLYLFLRIDRNTTTTIIGMSTKIFTSYDFRKTINTAVTIAVKAFFFRFMPGFLKDTENDILRTLFNSFACTTFI